MRTLACLALLLALPAAAQSRSLLFEENGGRFGPDVRFVARTPGSTLFLTDRSAVLALRTAFEEGEVGTALHMTFEGAAPATVRGVGELPTRIHYLLGADPGGWSTDNRTFERVRYDELWPGVDLLFYERRGAVEFDFVVAPGVDPGAIRLRFDGLSPNAGLQVNGAGELVLPTPAGDLEHSAPILHQEDAGGRRSVDGRFELLERDTVGFTVGAYDAELPLVIDPVLLWASYLEGNEMDAITGVATDAAGNIHVAGFTQSTDFPTTPGVYQPAGGDVPTHYDAFVAKIAPAGDALAWCTYLGGAASSYAFDGGEWAYGIAVDASGVYVCGGTDSADFPVTPGAYDTVPWTGFHTDGFVTKLTPAGDGLVWSTFLGAVTTELNAIAVDAAGNAYVVGMAYSQATYYPTTPGAFQEAAGGGYYEPVATKLSADGSALVWSSYLHGSDVATGYAYDVAVDPTGRATVVGLTASQSFPVVGGFQASYGGGFDDAFLARFTPDGSGLDYSTYLGGSASEPGGAREFGVAVDGSGRVWFAGSTESSDYPTTPGALQETDPGGGSEGVITCIDTNASGPASLLWSTYFGTGASDEARAVEVDASGNAWVLGTTSGTDIPTVDPGQPCSGGHRDYWLAWLDPSGGLLGSTYYGGSNNESDGSKSDKHGGLAIDPQGDVVLAGTTSSTDVGTAGAFQPVLTPDTGLTVEGIVAKLSPAQPPYGSHAIRTGCLGTLPPGSLVPVTATPSVGTSYTVQVDDPTDAAGMPPGSSAWWVISALPAIPGSPCGIPLPGWGVGGADGELLVNFNGSNPLFGPVTWTGPGSPAAFTVPIPCSASFLGAVVYTQGLLWDGAQGFALSEGLDLTLGI